MTQYLLSVHMVEGEQLPSPEAMQRAYRDVDALNDELKGLPGPGRGAPVPGRARGLNA